MDERMELLAATEFFADLSDEALAGVAAAAVERHFVRGDVVFSQDQKAEEMFTVVSGRIAIVNRSFDGRESVIALMEKGDLFGEMSLLDGLGRSADARALEPSSALAVPYALVQALFDEQPQLLWGIVRLLAGRVRTTDEALADSVFLDVTGRTAKRMLELAGSADEFVLPVTQEELAGMVGASRERVNKALSSFIRLGWIGQSDRRYRILDREKLAQRSR